MQLSLGMSRSYAVVDLETTGLDCWTDLIIEIGLKIVSAGNETQAESVLVKIDRPLPARIVELTGITDQQLAQDGMPIDDALAWFTKKIGDLPLVGHNVIKFDRGFLLEAARNHRKNVPQPAQVIDEVNDLSAFRFLDTMALFKGYKLCLEPNPDENHYHYARRVLEIPAQGVRFNLAYACNEVGINTSGAARHRAAGDADLTQQLFEKLLQLHPPQAFWMGGKYAI